MRARKRFGQNFLTDHNQIDKILNAIQPDKNDLIIEIGPGRGALTKRLQGKAGRLEVIEIDRDLVKLLHNELSPDVVIHEADVLRFDFAALLDPLDQRYKVKVIGNLPYNISTPLLFRLFSQTHRIDAMFFMLQLEVVNRICAAPSTKDYGRLSIISQLYCQSDKLFNVPATAFTPAPKVTSAIIQMIPHKDSCNASPAHPERESLLTEMLNRAFGQRRKTLRNALSPYLNAEELKQLGIDPGARPENLILKDYLSCVDFLLNKAQSSREQEK